MARIQRKALKAKARIFEPLLLSKLGLKASARLRCALRSVDAWRTVFPHPRCDAKGLDARGQLTGNHGSKAGQGVDHRLATTRKVGGTVVGTELTLGGEPSEYHAGQEAKKNVEDERNDSEHPARAVSRLVFGDEAVDGEGDEASQEHDECVDHDLDGGEVNPVIIGYVISKAIRFVHAIQKRERLLI